MSLIDRSIGVSPIDSITVGETTVLLGFIDINSRAVTLPAMNARQKIILFATLALACATFFTGINWGLPSRDSDLFLFGGRTPWTGDQIMQLAGAWDTTTSRGADIAMHPLSNADQPLVLNDTDARRAQIIRRYRLYSNQPDEMITFRSLSRMKPGKLDLDPAMYQYGGLWIYPVGALLEAAGLMHLLAIRGDLAFYIDHPDAFARFYLVARTYSAIWGLLGLCVVCALGWELSGTFVVGVVSAAIYACMPVVIDLAHEAKPHLAGTVLTLLTLWAAARYVRTGAAKHWIAAGIFAGASAGMVLTGYAAFAVLPVMMLLRSDAWKMRWRTLLCSSVIGIAVFTLTNPYLPFNLLFHRQVLHSNVGNYGTFYRPGVSISGLIVAGRTLLEGTSPVPLMVGIVGTALAALRRQRIQLLPASVAAVVLVQFVLLAEGKTAEYARFAMTLDVILALTAASFIGDLPITDREQSLAGALLVAATLYFGVRYDINFICDNRTDSTRMEAAERIEKSQARMISVWAEPAPYCMPPVDLFNRQILLEPRGTDASALPRGSIGVRPVDYPQPVSLLSPRRASSPISWANKPFDIIDAPVSSPTTRP